MAMTYAIKARGASGDMFERIVDITFDNAYRLLKLIHR